MPATWGKNTLTNQALTMMNQALGISAITFTKAVTITDDITGDSVSQLQALTSVNYKQSRTPKAIATQDNKSRLGVTIDNSDVNEDYIYYGIGLYAKQNSTNQEVLFSVIPLTAGATMIAKENNATTASIYLDLYTDIVRGTQVTIMVSNSGTLSREDVQQMISQSIGNALNYPNETASIGTDFNAILDISITRIINDTTVVNAPSGFSGTGYLTTIGSGDKTVPIMQTLDDTINNIRSTRYFNSTTNVWSEWNAYAKTVDVNQQLDKKVVDNKDGTEQLNDVQIQPFNKLTDVEDHRNYLTGTANDLIIAANASNFNYYRLFYPLVPGEKYTFSSEVALTGTANNVISVRVYQSDGNSNTTTINDTFVADGTRQSWTFVCPPNGYYLFVYAGVTGHTANIRATFHHSQLELGLPTPWHPSVLDKADDSTTLHNTGLGQITTDNSGIIVGNDGDFGIIKRSGHKAGIAIGSGNSFHFMTTNDVVLSNNSLYHDVWNIASTGQISILGEAYFTPADDSKVAHLSGAEEIGGQKTFDIAPIDKATGNPYITKDGVPSDVARTGQDTNFTRKLQKGGIDVATIDQLPVTNDTGWVDSQVNYTKQDGEWLKQRVKNGVLYIIGNLRVIGNTTDLTTTMGVKLIPSWKLPSPIVESYYINMVSNIQTTQKPGNAGTGWVCFNNSISVNHGYLLSFVTSNGESVQVAVNLAIPID